MTAPNKIASMQRSDAGAIGGEIVTVDADRWKEKTAGDLTLNARGKHQAASGAR